MSYLKCGEIYMIKLRFKPNHFCPTAQNTRFDDEDDRIPQWQKFQILVRIIFFVFNSICILICKFLFFCKCKQMSRKWNKFWSLADLLNSFVCFLILLHLIIDIFGILFIYIRIIEPRGEQISSIL